MGRALPGIHEAKRDSSLQFHGWHCRLEAAVGGMAFAHILQKPANFVRPPSGFSDFPPSSD
jgi:hypothetical protein